MHTFLFFFYIFIRAVARNAPTMAKPKQLPPPPHITTVGVMGPEQSASKLVNNIYIFLRLLIASEGCYLLLRHVLRHGPPLGVPDPQLARADHQRMAAEWRKHQTGRPKETS